MDIKVTPLGAGQDVGRSCIIVSIGGRNIMFDCGMHMGYNDHRRFPNFSYISKTGQFTQVIDAVIISHFHLDHCGALPHFSEQCGFDGPIIMTYPTKAICPVLLEDYRKITVERKGEKNFFTSENIKNCMKKVTGVNVHQVLKLDDDFEVTAYYAGHVLGAAMFHVRVGSQSVVYTGDYNMTPDRHLGSAWIDRVRPDLLITESTYATTIRDSKQHREQNFLKRVKECVQGGGKVLIPVFALGRAQELCILLDTFWERMNLRVPIYFAAGMTERANEYYKLFINWTNQRIKETFVKTRANKFDFKHIQAFDRSFIKRAGAMVVFATPGMLHAGLSLEIFKAWGSSDKNLVIMPGYCVAGTVGNKVLAGHKKIEIDKGVTMDVNCQIAHLSFSAHADAKGIMQLVRQSAPRNVVLVHGEKQKMRFLKEKIIQQFKVPCFCPANGTTITIKASPSIPVDLSLGLVASSFKSGSVLGKRSLTQFLGDADEDDQDLGAQPKLERKAVLAGDSSSGSGSALDDLDLPVAPVDRVPIDGVLLAKQNKMRLVSVSEALAETGQSAFELCFSATQRAVVHRRTGIDHDAQLLAAIAALCARSPAMGGDGSGISVGPVSPSEPRPVLRLRSLTLCLLGTAGALSSGDMKKQPSDGSSGASGSSGSSRKRSKTAHESAPGQAASSAPAAAGQAAGSASAGAGSGIGLPSAAKQESVKSEQSSDVESLSGLDARAFKLSLNWSFQDRKLAASLQTLIDDTFSEKSLAAQLAVSLTDVKDFDWKPAASVPSAAASAAASSASALVSASAGAEVKVKVKAEPLAAMDTSEGESAGATAGSAGGSAGLSSSSHGFGFGGGGGGGDVAEFEFDEELEEELDSGAVEFKAKSAASTSSSSAAGALLLNSFIAVPAATLGAWDPAATVGSEAGAGAGSGASSGAFVLAAALPVDEAQAGAGAAGSGSSAMGESTDNQGPEPAG